MKREMAGKMMSDVNGVEDVTAATAKELKATSTDANIWVLSSQQEAVKLTWNTSP